MTKIVRAAVLAPVLILAGLAALYGAGWFTLSDRFARSVALWLDAQRAQGIEISHAGIARGGFPFRLEARVLEPRAAFRAGRKAWTWTPTRAVFSARPWAPDRVTLDLSGAHAIIPADAPAGENAGENGKAGWRARAEALIIDARLHGSGATGLALTGKRIEIEGPATAEDFAAASVALSWRRVAASLTDRSPADHRGESQAFEVAAEGVRLSERARLPLGSEIARVKIAGRVMGELTSLRPGMGPGALGPWRDGGGTVEIEAIEGRYGALRFEGEGTLALDGAMQPLAALTARIEGYGETIDALRDKGAIRPRDAAAATLILAALAQRGDNGRPHVAVPVTIQDGVLFAGPVTLLRVPPIPW